MSLRIHNKRAGFRWLAAVVWLVFVCTFSAAQAAEHRLWGALVLANNRAVSEKPAAELAPYQKRLTKVFGYRNFSILGRSTRDFSDDSEHWLIPGEPFSLRSVVTPAENARFHVSLELFQGKKELVQTDAKLGADSPLFIRGPLYGDGQLIIVIMVQSPD